jgi:hypothetical protein
MSNLEYKKLLVDMYEVGQKISSAKQAGIPEVGPFWLLDDGRLLGDGLPVTEAPEVCGFKINPRDHGTIWGIYQRADVIPKDQKYDDIPRGRVTYLIESRKYVITADRCILSNPSAIAKIKSDMNLPYENTLVEDDEHYRCVKCRGTT